ncbi:hypothetical protein OG21DRAFT_1516606, partial [Imleria badia]
MSSSFWPPTPLASFYSTPTPAVQLSPCGHSEPQIPLLDKTPQIPLTPCRKRQQRD